MTNAKFIFLTIRAIIIGLLLGYFGIEAMNAQTHLPANCSIGVIQQSGGVYDFRNFSGVNPVALAVDSNGGAWAAAVPLNIHNWTFQNVTLGPNDCGFIYQYKLKSALNWIPNNFLYYGGVCQQIPFSAQWPVLVPDSTFHYGAMYIWYTLN